MLFSYTPYAIVRACDKALEDVQTDPFDTECIIEIRDMIIKLNTLPSSISLEWNELELIKEYL